MICCLEPVTEWERGDRDDVWVPNVVFTCGALPMNGSKQLLTADDELIVYYGGADTTINIATAQIGELIPLEVRESVSPFITAA